MRTVRRILRSIAAILLGFIVLMLAIAASFTLPQVQNTAAQEAIRYLKTHQNVDVELEKIRYVFPNRIRLRGLLVRGENGDTVVAADLFKTSIERLKIKKTRVALRFGQTKAEHLRLYMITPPGDSIDGFSRIIGRFKGETKAKSERAFKLEVDGFELADIRFRSATEACDSCFELDLESPEIAIRHFALKGDSIGAHIDRVRLIDRTRGIEAGLAGDVSYKPEQSSWRNMLIETSGSVLQAEILLEHPIGFSNFSDSVFWKIDLVRCRFDTDELRPFVHSMPRLGVVSAHGRVSGSLNNLEFDSLRAQLGQGIGLNTSGNISDLTRFESMSYDLDIHALHAEIRSLQTLFDRLGLSKLPLELELLGRASLKARLKGTEQQLELSGGLGTDLGGLKTELSVDWSQAEQGIAVLGDFSTSKLELGKALKLPDLGTTDGRFTLDARFGGRAVARGSVDAKVAGQVYRGYRYRNLSVQGDFDPKGFVGSLSIKDPNLDLDFKGDAHFAGNDSKLRFNADLASADLHALGLVKDSVSSVSAVLDVDLVGDPEGEILGKAEFHRITYENANNYYFFNDLVFESTRIDTLKSLSVVSDLFNGSVVGDYVLRDLPDFFAEYFRFFLFDRDRDSTRPGDFRFELALNNTQVLSEIFVPELYVEPGTYLEGKYERSVDKLSGRLISQSLRYADHHADNFKFSFGEYQGTPGARVTVDEYRTGGLTVDSISASILPVADSNYLRLSFIIPDTTDHKFLIRTAVHRASDSTYQFTTRASEFNLGPHLFKIPRGGVATIEPSRVHFENLAIDGGSAGMARIGGSISDLPFEILRLSLDRLDVSVLNIFMMEQGVSLAGNAEGELIMSELKSAPHFASDVFIDELSINGELLGDLELESGWSLETDLMTLRGGMVLGSLQTLGIEGSYQLDSNELDLDLGFDRFRLAALNPFLNGVLDHVRGYAVGGLHLEGKLDRLSSTGNLTLPNAAFRVPVLNVDYNFDGSPSLTISDEKIQFEKTTIRDSKFGTSGTVELLVSHDRFRDIALDLKIDARQMLCLNTTADQSDFYYGTAYGTGQITMRGPLDRMDLDVKARVEKGTHFVLPMGGPAEVGQKSFVEFKEPVVNLLDSIPGIGKKRKGNPLAIRFDLEVMPEAILEIIMDPVTGDGLKGKGKGQLNLGIQRNGEISMNGAVSVEGGSYSLTVGGLINRTFELQKGGQLNWNGTPYDAQVNLTAVYTTRTGLSPILPGEEYRSLRPDVQLSLLLTESLMNPNIQFKIKALNVSSDVESRLSNYFADEDELNKQAFSLLALNSFVAGSSVDEGNGNLLGNEITSQGLSTLSNFIFSGVSLVDVNVNYSIGTDAQTGTSQEEVEVALSKKFLDDRLTINGEFDVPVNSTSQSAQQILGDVEVIYDITPDGRFKARAFNESNYRSSTIGSINAYTQGAGIFYTTDFETWNELYRKLLGRKPKPVVPVDEADESP